eukprot:765856-Hanusia_phi.AAC.4
MNGRHYDEMRRLVAAHRDSLWPKLLAVAGSDHTGQIIDELRASGFDVEDLTHWSLESNPFVIMVDSSEVESKTEEKLDREGMVYTLLLNPSFRFQTELDTIPDGALQRVRTCFQDAFWRSLADDLRLEPPCCARVIKVLDEVASGVVDLFPSREAEIKGLIGGEQWLRRFEAGILQWPTCVELIRTTMLTVMEGQSERCRRATEEEWAVKRLELDEAAPEQQVDTFCRTLQFVLSTVNRARREKANEQIAPASRFINQNDHGVIYLQDMLAKHIRQDPGYLRVTPAWIRRAMQRAIDSHLVQRSELVAGSQESYRALHALAVTSLVTAKEPVTRETCPETLLVALPNLRTLNGSFRFAALAADMMRSAAAHLRIERHRLPPQQYNGLLHHLREFFARFDPCTMEDEVMPEQVVLALDAELTDEDREVVAACFKPAGPYNRTCLRSLLQRGSRDPDRTYLEVVRACMEQHWLRLSSMDLEAPDVRIPTNMLAEDARERALPHIRLLRKIISLDLRVHGDRYNALIADAVRDLP